MTRVYSFLFLWANFFWLSSKECVFSFTRPRTWRGCTGCSGSMSGRGRNRASNEYVMMSLIIEPKNTFNEGQMNFMATEKLIIVDENDCIIDESTKKEAHTFSEGSPRGMLHRAFSIFLFNLEGKLLLQQRAGDKITFPHVWSNTCCSHPTLNQQPNECDSDECVRRGEVNGIKRAAIRKLKQELGIDDIDVINEESIKYLTRLHYWAADKETHGELSKWGEHEIDYVLFVQADVSHYPNPEEVQDTKYVNFLELETMMKEDSGLLWSPWFRIIAKKFLKKWWKNLELTMNSDEFVDHKTIFRFDPAPMYFGGAGGAGTWLGAADDFVYKE